ncbi:MAG: class I SAM-dependent methyltransferase [Polyangiales bacterium]
MPRPLPPQLDEKSARTLAHYSTHAESFWVGTRDHDVTQNYRALLAALPGAPPRRILDFGCGPGRDLAALQHMGEIPIGLDGCPEFVDMARAHSGCQVIEQNFLELELAPASFEGIFANASLFHVPRAELPRVLGVLFSALVPDGTLFCSNPRAMSADGEGWSGDRYGCYLTIESWSHVIARAGFVLESQYLRPSGKPPSEQPWLAMVWRKPRD